VKSARWVQTLGVNSKSAHKNQPGVTEKFMGRASTFAVGVTVIDNSGKFGKADGSEDDKGKWR
jgi:hypothetical protein